MPHDSPMTAEEIFMAAAEHHPGGERDALLCQLCAGNVTLRAEVVSLLNAHDSAGSFLAQPFVNLSATNLSRNSQGDAEDRSGSRLGRYQLNSRIGSGGMGEVYRAHDTQLEREVAIKLLAPVHTSNAVWLRRFHREAKAAGAVNHPNILTIYEIGSVADLHFIATEFIEGITLRTLLAGHALKLSQVLEMSTQIASALVAAHAANIVHRDLKPENIMVRGDGLIKVLDFGLAKHLDPSDSQPRLPGQTFTSAPAHHISGPGSVMGTIHYMSPEQARGLAVDTRSDLFSFGIVLFEMLTGQQPFSGATSSDVLVAILEREPPRPVNSGYRLPDELERIVSKALRKDRDLRYQSAKDLHADLKRMLDESERPTIARVATLRTRSDDTLKNVAHDVSLRRILDASPDAETPEVRYTCSGEVNIAYQVFGEGAIDLVFVMGWVSHLEWFWKEPSFASFLRRLGTFARVILFDKRGTGLSDRVPATVLAARPVRTSSGDRTKFDSHERFERYQSHVLREVDLFRGSNVAFTDDSFLATFDGPTRAIRAALAINDSARRLGLSLQAGLHIGECDVLGHNVRGAAVDFASRISQIADIDEVLVSSTIKDLVAGSGIHFTERSAETLPEGTKLFRVQR